MLKTISATLLALFVLTSGSAMAKVRCFTLMQDGAEAAWFVLDSDDWDHPTDDFTGTWSTADDRSGTIEGTYYLIVHKSSVRVNYVSIEDGGDPVYGTYLINRRNLLTADCVD